MKHDEIVITVSENGSVNHLYDDALRPFDELLSGGSKSLNIKRASTIEPNADGKWEVCLVTGEVLVDPKTGLPHFESREEANAFEVLEINRRLVNGTWDSKFMTA